ncbi:hypothetical protein FB480_103355 [Agrobacterium vitis]|nr:hypothetical protein FB480_103355 [Agrobacterium vitis]
MGTGFGGTGSHLFLTFYIARKILQKASELKIATVLLLNSLNRNRFKELSSRLKMLQCPLCAIYGAQRTL